MKISLFAKNHDTAYQIEEAIRLEAFKRDYQIDDDNPDVIIYIGGDGTFLEAVQNNLDRLDSVIFVGVNTGNLGFFYEFQEDEIEELFAYLDSGSLKLRRINLMECQAGNKKEKFDFYALNEVRCLAHEGALKCDVLINDELLENFTGNELVISSSCGSTGLNKSIGGAIISPELTTFQITPIAPINNKVYSTLANPVIFYNNVNISLRSIHPCHIAFDHISLDEDINYLHVARSNLFVSVFFRPDRSFIDKLKESFIK